MSSRICRGGLRANLSTNPFQTEVSSITQVSQEILELLNTTTAKEQSIVEKFRSRGRAQVQEFCDYGTKEECMKASDADRPCRKLHFRSFGGKRVGWVS